MKQALTIIFLLVALTLPGQVDQSEKIVVLSCKGTVKYTETENNKEVDVLPGIFLPRSGSIFIDDGAKVRLIIKDQSQLFKGPGRYDLEEVYRGISKKTMSFSSRFWNFVMEGMGNTDDKKDLIKYHKHYMNVHGGLKGFAPVASGIQLINPLGGFIGQDKIVFEWKTPTDETGVTFELFDSKGNVLLQKKVKENHIAVDLEQDIKTNDNFYAWRISSDSSTMNAQFEHTDSFPKSIADKLSYLEAYGEADQDEKEWMKAVILEMEEYYYEAGEIYKNLIAADESNQFLKRSYALLLSRQGRLVEAENLITKL